ncbi:MAG: hypothetical protein DSY92_01525 [Planctomycetota bacterium]|nr:MAG: hypothetical protein DSY92_01525 [Planctomycetota bacterium]
MPRLPVMRKSGVQPGWAEDTSDEVEAAGPEAMQIQQYLDPFSMPWSHASLSNRIVASMREKRIPASPRFASPAQHG